MLTVGRSSGVQPFDAGCYFIPANVEIHGVGHFLSFRTDRKECEKSRFLNCRFAPHVKMTFCVMSHVERSRDSYFFDFSILTSFPLSKWSWHCFLSFRTKLFECEKSLMFGFLNRRLAPHIEMAMIRFLSFHSDTERSRSKLRNPLWFWIPVLAGMIST